MRIPTFKRILVVLCGTLFLGMGGCSKHSKNHNEYTELDGQRIIPSLSALKASFDAEKYDDAIEILDSLLKKSGEVDNTVRFVFSEMCAIAGGLLQMPDKEAIVERLYKGAFDLVKKDETNAMFFPVFICLNYATTTKIVTYGHNDINSFTGQMWGMKYPHFKSEEWEALKRAVQPTVTEYNNLKQSNPMFAYYEDEIEKEISGEWNAIIHQNIDWLHYFLAPNWWTQFTDAETQKWQTPLAAFFRMAAIVKIVENTDNYWDSRASIDSLKRVITYSQLAGYPYWEIMQDELYGLSSLIETWNPAFGDVGNSEKERNRNWLKQRMKIGKPSTTYQKSNFGEMFSSFYYADFTREDRATYISKDNNCFFPDEVDSFSSDFDADCLNDKIDWDIDNDGVTNHWDLAPWNPGITYDDLDNDFIPDHLDRMVNGNIKRGYDQEDAALQQTFFSETGYVLVNGKERFTKDEIKTLLLIFRQYPILTHLTDSLKTIIKDDLENTNALASTNSPQQAIFLSGKAFILDKTYPNKIYQDFCKTTSDIKINIAQAIVHEIGHIIKNRDRTLDLIYPGKFGRVQKLIEKQGWFYFPSPDNGLLLATRVPEWKEKSLISDYAIVSDSEYFAELWSTALLLSQPWIGQTSPLSPEDICSNIFNFYYKAENCKTFRHKESCDSENILSNFELFQSFVDLIKYINSDEWREKRDWNSSDILKTYMPYRDKIID